MSEKVWTSVIRSSRTLKLIDPSESPGAAKPSRLQWNPAAAWRKSVCLRQKHVRFETFGMFVLHLQWFHLKSLWSEEDLLSGNSGHKNTKQETWIKTHMVKKTLLLSFISLLLNPAAVGTLLVVYPGFDPPSTVQCESRAKEGRMKVFHIFIWVQTWNKVLKHISTRYR